MRVAAFAVCLLVGSGSAGAQDWREAYVAGDYQKAAALLHPVVMEVFGGPDHAPDAAAFELLADLYARGLGVQQDGALACALFDHASRAEQSVHSGNDLDSVKRSLDRRARIERLRIERCDSLGHAERAESSRLLACPTAPFPTHTFDLDLAASHSIEVDRRGIRIRRGLAERSHDASLFGCTAGYVLARHSRVEAPRGSGAPARHFLELFTWSLISDKGTPQLGLLWHVMEIMDTDLKPRAMEILAVTPRIWPLATPPATMTTVDLTMDRTGTVRWRFAGTGAPAGVFER